MRKMWIITAITAFICGLFLFPAVVSAENNGEADHDTKARNYIAARSYTASRSSNAVRNDAATALIQKYKEYQAGFAAIETVADIEDNGYEIIEDQSFPMSLEVIEESPEEENTGEDEVSQEASRESETVGEASREEFRFVPIMHKEYHRLAILITDSEGKVLYKTDQLATNFKYLGQLEQPTKSIAAVAFLDLNFDGLNDIVLITNCQNETGGYAGETYKVGDVLFQQKTAKAETSQPKPSFYRDWRISDKINRFSMNKSVKFITAHVRDGSSTEILYTATTQKELLDNGFEIIKEHNYSYNFEKQGILKVVPGVISMSVYDVFMIYLVNEQGNIVWSFQPMSNYDNLYALKGMACKDLDGDGLKDILVLGRYSYNDENGEFLIDTKCSIYYQRTDGFVEDMEFSETYSCTEEDTVGGLVEIIRDYWGWPKEK